MSKLILAPIKLLGRYASFTLPAGIVIGLILPELAKYLKPLHYTTLLIPLTLALVRIKTEQIVESCKNWRLVSLLIGWNLVFSAVIVWLLLSVFEIPTEISMAAIIATSAPPITASAAIALILRLTQLLPLSSPLSVPF